MSNVGLAEDSVTDEESIIGLTQGGKFMILTCVNLQATGRRIKSEQSVYKWMRGDSLPTVDNLLRLSELFQCHMDDIVVADHSREESESSLLPLYGDSKVA